jgi:hypothetical protein
MRELKISAPPEASARILQIAQEQGVQEISVNLVHDAQGNQKDQIKLKTSTPQAHQVLQRLRTDAQLPLSKIKISSHQLNALISDSDLKTLTRPFCMPPDDVIQDFWQTTHITLSFLCRVLISAMLLSYAMLEDRFVLMIGAMLFTVFSPCLMGWGLGFATRDSSLIRQAAVAFLIANSVSIGAAAVIAILHHGPLLWNDFGTLGGNLFVAAASTIVGAVSDADDAGRRQLIAIAAAFPYARFPPWVGICLVKGFPESSVVLYRLGMFGASCVVMVVLAAMTYALLGFRRYACQTIQS